MLGEARFKEELKRRAGLADKNGRGIRKGAKLKLQGKKKEEGRVKAPRKTSSI